MNQVRRLYYFYRRFIWYKTQGYNEVMEPVNGIGTFISLFTFFAVVFNLKFAWWGYVLILLASILVLAVVGLILVRWGVIAYVTQLNNQQNPEILAIKKMLEDSAI